MFKGLNTEQVRDSREKHGSNTIIETSVKTFWEAFKEAFDDAFIKLLLGVAAIMLVLASMGYAEFAEIIGIIGTVLLVTYISARTAVNGSKAFQAVKDSIKKDTVKVYRNGEVVEVVIDDIVVGDMVILQSGDKIPADGILIDGAISVDNSSLNGESEECKKTAVMGDFKYNGSVKITGDTFVDKHSLFRGAVVVNGKGILEVKKVGMSTVMGQMAEDMQDEEVEGPLQVKLAALAEAISKFGYIGAASIALIMLVFKIVTIGGFNAFFDMGAIMVLKTILEIVSLAIVIIVMAVPEGLPLMVAVVLKTNMGKMLADNILITKAIGAETAGSMNILFSDKTGTITKGELEVVEFFDGALKDSYKNEKIRELMAYAIGKNTDAMFDIEGKILGGNATDKALLSYLGKDVFNSKKDIEVSKSQSFNSSNKYSSAEINGTTYYKGAPERLMSCATKYIDANGNICSLDKKAINKKIDELADRAMRVLAFGYSESPLEDNKLPNDLVIIGFVAIRDEVRPTAKKAIAMVQKAGIQVTMITGDRKETAVAIAKDAGLIKSKDDVALTSEELNNLSDEEVKEILPRLKVIARALPTDKSRMVRLAQELNLVCGMTGDGVNDAPALKRADVGFAMGSGTDVAKEAGEIVILDDNFESIAKTILYGRTIYNNILKFIKFQLTINVAAVTVCAIAPFFGIEEPLKITHILWINLIMDGLGAIALGGEPALEKYMLESPKSRTQSLVTKAMMSQVLVAGGWLAVLGFTLLKLPMFATMFDSETAHLTAFFTLFVLTAVFNGFNVRSEGLNLFEHISQNKAFFGVMGSIVLIQIVLTFVGGSVFSCEPFGFKAWLTIVGLALTIIPIDMIRKLIVNK